MIVAVAIMWMVQAPIDQVTDVIAVRHCLMPASGPMHMIAVCILGMFGAHFVFSVFYWQAHRSIIQDGLEAACYEI